MKRVFVIFAAVITMTIVLLFVSCEKIGYKYSIGKFPDIPVNFEELNTEYDDYNSDIPTLGETFPLCFSTNRNSKGANFDIVYKLISISFSKRSGKLSIYENTSSNLDVYIENSNIHNALTKINTSSNEMGPYLIPQGRKYNGTNINKRYESYIFLYSSDESGNQDIYFTENIANENYNTPVKVKFLNSEFDDLYPTFNKDFSEIYFSSNREGTFSIYKVSVGNSQNIIDILSQDSDLIVEKVFVLSSDYDDKCPYIVGDYMVFASNRSGGYGSYDLYYSRYKNGEWQPPVNFGNKINTEYDEFRPIVRIEGEFKNDFMLFSSNRPGGKGGFDLYYVGIDKIRD